MSDDNEQKNNHSGEDSIPTYSHDSTIEKVGSQIGPYKLFSILGEGGMGIVYLAEQQRPVKRRVALKIIKPGMDSKRVLARFEAERQVLALLDHPNIAHMFDAGATEAGRPYFAMEHVEGVPITEYCDREKLNIEDRLNLFAQICDAIQHAHQKGIIHRDIKPSNILVSIEDEKAIPKVIDFGVAKATSQPLTERTLFTEQGQLIGTPEYMSPEQAEMTAQNIDTRTDIYSLGVVLYELLTGALPFDPKTFRRAAFGEIQRIIREKDPPRPSTKLSSLGEEAKTVAQRRRTEIKSLTKRLHQELEWIPLKAIRKERSHRYRSASEFADDIQNYLEGNPLIAGPESTSYRMKKFVRRNHALVMGITAVLVVLIAGIVTSTIFAIGQHHARTEAERAQMIAETAQIEEEKQRKLAQQKTEAARKSLYFNRIALIEVEHKNGNTAKVLELLQQCPPDLRNWEYDYLQYISDQTKFTLRGHTGRVTCVMFTPDGKHIVSGGNDNTIKLWDVGSGQESMTFLGHEASIISVDVSPDGRRLASSSHDGTIRLWNIDNGVQLNSITIDTTFSEVTFSPDGKKLAFQINSTIQIWDANLIDKLLTIEIDEPDVRIAALAFSPDGNRLVCGTYGRKQRPGLRLWDANTGDLIREVPQSVFRRWKVSHFHNIEFSSDGELILSSNWNQAWLWDADTLEVELAIPRTHEYGSYTATLRSDGKTIVSAGVHGPLRIWDAINGQLIRTLNGHIGIVRKVVFNPDGNLIASAGYDGTVRIWGAHEDKEQIMLHLAHPHNPVKTVSYNRRGNLLASGGRGSVVRIWDTERWKALNVLLGHTDSITCVGFNPDGTRLISSSLDSSIRIWDISGQVPELEHVIMGHSDAVNSVQYSPDGRYIVSGSSDQTIRIWQADTQKLRQTLEGHSLDVTAARYTKDGSRIVSCSKDKTIRVWDTETGKEKLKLTGQQGNVTCVAISPDDKWIVSGDNKNMMILWNAETGEKIFDLQGHYLPINAIIFSRDGERIFSASNDFTVRVWDVKTGTTLMTLSPPDTGEIYSLAQSPDSTTLVGGGGWGGPILVWSSHRFEKYESHKKIIYSQNLGMQALEDNPENTPSHAKSFSGHRYFLYSEPMNWKAAKEYCESVGGHLATITSKEENDWIVNTFPPSLTYWLGGTDEKGEGRWKWVTGEKWQYSAWCEGKPNKTSGIEHALEMQIIGLWNENADEKQSYFLIEWDR